MAKTVRIPLSEPIDGHDGPIREIVLREPTYEPYELRREHGGDRRGWPGDAVPLDPGERPMGSKLWLYRRAVLDDRTGLALEAEVVRALQPLVDQRAVVRVEAKAVVARNEGVVRLTLNLFGRDGASAYADQFDLLWSRVDGGL